MSNMDQSKNIEMLSEDKLDDDIMDIFKPIFFLQRIFGFLGMNIKYGFATAPSSMYQVYCVVIWIISIICVVDFVLTCETKYDHMSTDTPLKLGLVISACTNAVLVWRKHFSTGNMNCQVFIKLQKIERKVMMKKAKNTNKNLFIITITATIIATMLLMLWLLVVNTIPMKELCPSMTLATMTASANFIEIFLVFIIIYFIAYRVEYINKILLKKSAINAKRVVCVSKINCMSNGANILDEKVSDELVLGVYYILDGFETVMDLFQCPIFISTGQMLAWHLITMQNLVISFKKQMTVDFPSFLCTVPASLTILILILALCLVSDALTSRLEKTKNICTNILSATDGGKSRRNAKRVILLLNGKRNASIYNIYTLDARLPLHLLAITASYTIVLLQFAVL